MWCHSSTPTATGASLEAQEVIDDDVFGRPVVAIPTARALMRGPEQADGNIKERIWCGEPPTVQMGVKGGQSPHRAEGGGGHWASAGGAGVGHRTGGCARARAPETRLSLTGAEAVEKRAKGAIKKAEMVVSAHDKGGSAFSQRESGASMCAKDGPKGFTSGPDDLY